SPSPYPPTVSQPIPSQSTPPATRSRHLHTRTARTMPRARPTTTKPPAAATKTLTPRRSSTRLKSSPLPLFSSSAQTNKTTKTTPKKSQFFSHSTEEKSESEVEDEGSGYEDEDASASLVSSEEEEGEDDEDVEEEEDDDGSGDAGKKKRKRGGRGGAGKGGGKNGKKMKIKKISSSAVDEHGYSKGEEEEGEGKEGGKGKEGEKGKELWREGVKSHLAPGEEIFVKLPKARGDGGVKYEAGVVHPNTLMFLGDLGRNNERGWLKVHDADYRQSKKDWDAFVEKMTEKIIEIDDTIPELPPKDLTFRIYRDVRFSSDPTPYKTHFSAAWSRTGRKGPYAAYYLQIKPNGGSFLGGGLWCPEAAPLAALRRMIDKKARKLTEVLMAPAMRREFLGRGGPRDGDDEANVIGAFCKMNEGNALKTRPKLVCLEEGLRGEM
ncbi:MAG: hypothetical protein L6R37_007148, partial [Teloschistes peruensis]